MQRLPAALFVVDIMKEHIAVSEARRLNIPVFGIVDTNSDPELVDFPIPANDDAANSIAIILDTVVEAMRLGSNERKLEKDNAEQSEMQPRKTKRSSRERTKVNDDEDVENKKSASNKKLTKKVKNINEE
jgi:small subunit ribosomal protein S2